MKRLAFLVLLAGCSGSGKVGGACGANGDCASKLCLKDNFPGGYCSSDCTSNPCPDGETCSVAGLFTVCLANCAAPTDCRSGYQCFGGVCRPPCGTDDECGTGFICSSGACMMKPGSPVGSDCAADSDCASDICLSGICQQGCAREADCSMTQTCFVNPYGDAAASPTSRVVPICVDRRNTKAIGSPCTKTADCDRGSCQLGMCVEMCSATSDCTRAGTGCAGLSLLLDDMTSATFKSCLPSNTMIDYDDTSGTIAVPSTAQSFSIYTHVEPFDFNLVVGVLSLNDPNNMALFTQPMSTADFYALPIRYVPVEGSSTMLVPNTDQIALINGVYSYFAGTSNPGQTPKAHIYMKLHDAPITAGSAPLNIYYTDLTGGCGGGVTFSELKNGGIGSAINTVKRIYQQVNINLSSINFIDVSADTPNTIRVADSGNPLPDLDQLVLQATANRGTTVGFDVVLIRTITDQNGNPSNVLGSASGIPTDPVLGSAHTGAAVSLEALCGTDQATFGATLAHELAHSVGLFHNIEMMSQFHDPLTDTAADGVQNLMYWLEDSGQHLSTQQGDVMRRDPKVTQ